MICGFLPTTWYGCLGREPQNRLPTKWPGAKLLGRFLLMTTHPMASLKKSHLVRIRWFGILAAAALVGGCVFFGRGSTVVDIEVAGFVSITGAAVTEAPKPLNPRGRTDGAASLSPVAEAPIRGLLVGVERVSNFEVQLSFTNQSAAPVLLSLDRGSVHFSFEPAARPIGPKPVYFLYRLDTPKVVLVQDFRTNTAGKPPHVESKSPSDPFA